MNRREMKHVISIPEKYSDATCVVASHEGEVGIGLIMDDESECFLIPEEIFQKLIAVYAGYLDQIQEEITDPNRKIH